MFQPTSTQRDGLSNNAEVARCIRLSFERVKPLSRSFNGESNTDTSEQKPPLLTSGPILASLARQNFLRACSELVSIRQDALVFPTDAQELLLQVAGAINHGLIEPTRSIFRTWETGICEHTPVAGIEEGFRSLATELHSRWPASFSDSISFAAWVERSLNAHGHLLTDGCGRISKAFSVAALARQGLVYPSFDGPTEYIDLITGDEGSWYESYRERVSR